VIFEFELRLELFGLEGLQRFRASRGRAVIIVMLFVQDSEALPFSLPSLVSMQQEEI